MLRGNKGRFITGTRGHKDWGIRHFGISGSLELCVGDRSEAQTDWLNEAHMIGRGKYQPGSHLGITNTVTESRADVQDDRSSCNESYSWLDDERQERVADVLVASASRSLTSLAKRTVS